MMKDISYSANGVVLKSLMPGDLELLRDRRNDPGMRKWMTTDHEITEEEMLCWYSRLTDDAFYMLVYCDGSCVGHVNAKPKGNGIYDPGYMFWDDSFKQQGGSARAVMAFFNFMFEEVHAVELQALTACDNTRALRLAHGLGFAITGIVVVKDRSYEQLSLTRQGYAVVRQKYEALFQ